MKKSSLSQKMLDKPYLLWSVLFIIVPLVMVVFYAFTDKTGAFTFSNIAQIKNYFPTILLSVLYGLAATVICVIIGYPFAYALSKHSVNTQRTMVLLVMLPMWMNFLIRTYSLMTILGDSGVVNNLLNALGLKSVHMINTGGAVIFGMVYNFLPYMILPIYTVLSKLDNSLVEAAHDLGSGRATTFRRVILPLSLPGLLSGITMVFVPCVSTFYITQKLGGGQIVLIGDVIETQFQSANNYHLGAALSFVLMILIFVCLGVMNYFDDGTQDGGVVI
ncbi:MAG: ABC transporter permease [Eubacterium coprostanoligenes]|uniref:Spermidine/putrescine transport system permease protein n=1 Tax=Eubacterium coprostanoligenes TaxID=290054 RepID=A0A1T4N930_9FIRM|nr:ABC transporter permease [Eubacterium coprostanoligenes]MCI6361430.1 ABC transporter permease [Eubacterium coprostanoligenes]MDD6665812.1 ABC transporter permease [Eubacterium coprostanoligenes]MDD7358028.1 ABC transporter permease [Eubacterium coprostanoligenes]SJZ75732.1 spermidine/putrescine transport system permease protein [Eubacterium coprostanoligenes]